MHKPLSPHRRAILHAVVDCMVPADETPSGWEAGVGDFIERMLGQELDARRLDLEQGLDLLGDEAHGMFVDSSADDRATLLMALESGAAGATWPIDPTAFVGWLAAMCAQGYYGDPGNGGNREEVSWRAMGYRVLPAGRSWPAPEPAPGPTIRIEDLRPSYDVVVVGAGAGGGVAAQVCSEAGLTVLLVERGAALSSEDLPLDQLRSERSVTGYPTRTGPAVTGEPRVVEGGDGPLAVFAPDPRWGANAFAVGGGTRVYGAQAWRFAPEDFRMASKYGVPADSALADWPIAYEDLEPWYDRCEWEYGVSGDPGGMRFVGARRRGYPMPALQGTVATTVLQAGAEKLGVTTSAVPLLINSIPYNGRPACERCGTCVGFACHAAAKNGSHNTSIPRALDTGRCDLLVSTHVARVVVNAGVVTGVDLIDDATGEVRRTRVVADRVVIAAGAIETARLLLHSAHDGEPNGIGNDHDLVGRTLQSHVYAGAIGVFSDVVQDSLGPGPSIATNDFRHDNPGVVGGGMIANDFVPTPLNTWDTLARLGVIPRWGAVSKRRMRELWPRMQMVFGPAQEMPNAESRVTLDPEVRDRFGIPVARLMGDIHPEDRRTAALLADRAAEWLKASGAEEVVRLAADDRPRQPSGGQHQAGTCRMGTSPDDSVTDSWGRVWGHDNLLIADGSVHVTNGGVNPVLTIMALAYRNSTHLVAGTPAI